MEAHKCTNDRVLPYPNYCCYKCVNDLLRGSGSSIFRQFFLVNLPSDLNRPTSKKNKLRFNATSHPRLSPKFVRTNYERGHAFAGGAFLAIAHDYKVMRSDRGWISWNETLMNLRLGEPFIELLK
ncbi:hypothetical protein KUTeg_019680 [Tegillarca granosa]|uniref:Uncharacterized protein n=1 Tax=Tegillarca granosa TaxID=220873 RepID=A0ABQ9EFB0_TEGGR|nr:hypothetical protein KUTeg_019680 [Tegillarca granosa]